MPSSSPATSCKASIAHEFSHILNGDMRLNLRLIGVLHGILLMGLVGRELLRIAGHGGRGTLATKTTASPTCCSSAWRSW